MFELTLAYHGYISYESLCSGTYRHACEHRIYVKFQTNHRFVWDSHTLLRV